MLLSRLSFFSMLPTSELPTPSICFINTPVNLRYSVAFLPLIISYTIEILPFPVRAKGFTLYSLTLSIALIFNQYVNPIARQKLGWKYYVGRFIAHVPDLRRH